MVVPGRPGALGFAVAGAEAIVGALAEGAGCSRAADSLLEGTGAAAALVIALGITVLSAERAGAALGPRRAKRIAPSSAAPPSAESAAIAAFPPRFGCGAGAWVCWDGERVPIAGGAAWSPLFIAGEEIAGAKPGPACAAAPGFTSAEKASTSAFADWKR